MLTKANNSTFSKRTLKKVGESPNNLRNDSQVSLDNLYRIDLVLVNRQTASPRFYQSDFLD